MSLYTPVFPSFHEPNTSRKAPNDTILAASPGKQQSYIEFLRDVHLFLSTQSDVLSPPSRPISPLFDHHVQEVRNKVRNVVHETEGKTSSGKWAHVSQTLKLGCVRGRHWSASGDAPRAPDPETEWILPEEESEWIEWEKKREENRRLKAKTNASLRLRTGMTAPVAPDSQKANHGSFSQPYETAPERPPPGVSPTIIRAAREKVRKWQASVTSESTAGPSSIVAAASIRKSKTEGPQRSGTLDFSVVKPAAKAVMGKKGKGFLSRPSLRGGSAPLPLQKSKSPTPAKATSAPEVEAPLTVDETATKAPAKASDARDEIPKIADVPETPYIPPSFPEHLQTSTPLPDSAKIVRAKPSPIFPLAVSSTTPLPPTCVDPPNECELVFTEPHAATVSSCLPPHPPQIDTEQPGKRSRLGPPSLDGVPNDPSFTPPAKRSRTETERDATDQSRPILPNMVGLDIAPFDDARDPELGLASSHQDKMETPVMAPSTPVKTDHPPTDTDGQGFFPEKIPSPSKSVKSYFSSAADSDGGDSPMKANLLLESPVSPMLSYAQNASGFLPQITSTQPGRKSPSAGRTSRGVFGMGYSSQFDVERQVDRVSELLEKDVDFEGWLRDVRTVEMSQD